MDNALTALSKLTLYYMAETVTYGCWTSSFGLIFEFIHAVPQKNNRPVEISLIQARGPAAFSICQLTISLFKSPESSVIKVNNRYSDMIMIIGQCEATASTSVFMLLMGGLGQLLPSVDSLKK